MPPRTPPWAHQRTPKREEPVYRARPSGEDEEGAEEPADEEQRDASLATNAYRLLNAWDTPPGLVDGVMNAEVLRAWLDRNEEDAERFRRGLH